MKTATRARVVGSLRWILSASALAFVVWMVPVRDQCWDPHAARSTRVSVTRDAYGCVLHLRSGEVHIDAGECGALKCEPGVGPTLAHARTGIISALLALYAFGTIAWAARWRMLLALAGVDLSLWRVWRVSIEAQAAGILLPGGIGGDALRIAYVVARPPAPAGSGRRESRLALVIASVLLDRAIGLAIVAALAVVLACAWGGGLRGAGPVAGSLAVIPLAIVAGLVTLRRLRPPRWLEARRVGNFVRPVLEYARHPGAPRAILAAAALSVVVAGVQFATIRGLVYALGVIPTAEKWVYLGAAMAFVASALPTLPGAWGTADAAYVFFFGFAGVAPGTALAVCLVYRLFWYLTGVAGAILHLARSRHGPASAGAASVGEPPS